MSQDRRCLYAPLVVTQDRACRHEERVWYLDQDSSRRPGEKRYDQTNRSCHHRVERVRKITLQAVVRACSLRFRGIRIVKSSPIGTRSKCLELIIPTFHTQIGDHLLFGLGTIQSTQNMIPGYMMYVVDMSVLPAFAQMCGTCAQASRL